MPTTLSVNADTRLRRETAGFKLTISATDNGGFDGTPVYIDGDGEQILAGVLLATLQKGLDGHDFFSLVLETSMYGMTIYSLPNEVTYIRKGTVMQNGPDTYCMATTGIVSFDSGDTMSGQPMSLTYISETGELFTLGRQTKEAYLYSRGFMVPYNSEGNFDPDSPAAESAHDE